MSLIQTRSPRVLKKNCKFATSPKANASRRNFGCTTPLALNTPVTILSAPTISGAFANAAHGATFVSNGRSYRLNDVMDSNPATLDTVTLTILVAAPEFPLFANGFE